MNPFDQQAPIPGIKNIVVVGSGKGGVGKSTVTCNLAVALADTGLKVGILDADIYGPSIPRMMGLLRQKPEVNDQNKIIPLTRLGLKIMSMGFLVDEGAAIVWRGPMLFKAIDQFFHDVDWGELDVLLIDLPPGTGDVALTIAQKVPVSGGIVVCTPQNMALMDAQRAIDMFDRIQLPKLGVVKNMAAFIPPGGKELVHLFPEGDLHRFLEEKNLPLLAEIPFDPQVGLYSEAGVSIVTSDQDNTTAKAFIQLAQQLKDQLK